MGNFGARRLVVLVGLLALPSGFGASRAHAQAPTGYEVALSGMTHAMYGEPFRVAGTAFEVLGLATLRPLAGAEVTGALFDVSGREPVEVARNVATADRSGRFALEIIVPLRDMRSIRFDITLGRRGGTNRSFTYALTPHAPYTMTVLADRARYEPGETVHVFARAFAKRSGAPVVEREVRFVLRDPAGRLVAEERKALRPSGSQTLDIVLPRSLADGTYMIEVELEGGPGATAGGRSIEVARRTVERLLVQATLDDDVIAPGAMLTGRVSVHTPSGANVSGATVVLTMRDGRPVTLTTNETGEAPFRLSTPLFLAGTFEQQDLDVRVTHAAHGTLHISTPYTLTRARWRVSVVAANHVIVPEVPTSLYFEVEDFRGRPAPAGTEIEAHGPGIAEGVRVAVDAEGFAEVPLRLPLGAGSSLYNCDEAEAGMQVVVDVHGTTTDRTELCLGIDRHALVRPRVVNPFVASGGVVEVDLARRPGAASRPIFVEVLDGLFPIASAWAEGNTTRVQVALPENARGFFEVRARAVSDIATIAPLDRPGTVALGGDAFDAIFVRPRDAFGVSLRGNDTPYGVRTTARIALTPTRAIEQAYATLVVRDLAQHGGEFDYFHGDFSHFAEVIAHDRRDSAGARSMLTRGIVHSTTAPPEPPMVVPPWDMSEESEGPFADMENGSLRDPLRMRDILLRSRVGAIEMALESALEEVSSEMDAGNEDEDEDEEMPIVVRRGRFITGFHPRALETLLESGGLDEEEDVTLGGGRITLAMIEQADPSFRFERVAARIARKRLVHVMSAIVAFSSPDDENAARLSAGSPPDRWISRMIELDMLTPSDVLDPWGRPFAFRRVSTGTPRYVLSERAPLFEVVSAGPDGRFGSADDVRDPFGRLVPEGTPYAVASGEDELMGELSTLAPGESTLEAMIGAYSAVGLAAMDERRRPRATIQLSEIMIEGRDDGEVLERNGRMNPYGDGGGSELNALTNMAFSAQQRPPSTPAMTTSTTTESSGDIDPAPEAPRLAQLVPEAEAERSPVDVSAANLVRENFPATLFFAGEIPLEGAATHVDIPLADALTTYRIEAMAWSNSGWSTSARTEIRVDQEATVDAPVPPFATVGDVLRIPVRIANRSSAPLEARVELTSETASVSTSGPETVHVAPHDAALVVVEARAVTEGEGSLVVRAVRASDDAPLDATRRPIRVFADARLVRVLERTLLEGGGPIAITVPAHSTARGPAELTLATGLDFFGPFARESLRDRLSLAWLLAFADQAEEPGLNAELVAYLGFDPQAEHEAPPANEIETLTRDLWRYDHLTLARAIGAGARTRAVSDESLVAALTTLSADFPEGSERARMDSRIIARDADLLLLLAPALDAGRQGATQAAIVDTVQRLRALVANAAAHVSDDAYLEVTLAAALAMTASAGGLDIDPRAVELLRRVDWHVVVVGDIAFLEETARYGSPSARIRPTAMLAIARLAIGDRQGAFACMRALARLRRLDESGRFLATLALAMLTPRADRTISARVDGASVALVSAEGALRASLPDLGTPGSHTIDVALAEGTFAWAELSVRYGRPWDAPEPHPLNVTLAIDGALGARDTRAALTVSAENRSPRTLQRPVLEIDLPTGVELDEPTREAIARFAGAQPTVESRTLRIALRPLAPGATIRVPLPLRWSVGGAFRGLGVALHDDVSAYDDVHAYAVLPSRLIEIPDTGEEPARVEIVPSVRVPRPITPMLRPLAPGL